MLDWAEACASRKSTAAVPQCLSESFDGKDSNCAGLKVTWFCAQALMANGIACLLYWRSLPLFYVTSVLCALQRSATLSVPFLLARRFLAHAVCTVLGYVLGFYIQSF